MPVDQLTPENTTFGGLVVLVLYYLWRRIKSDTYADRTADREGSFRDDVIAMNKTLNERCDQFAHERNVALAKVAELNTKIAIMQRDLDRARAGCNNPATCGFAE